MHPRWSPDGLTLAYVGPTTVDGRGLWRRGGEISLMNASTGARIRRLGPSLTRGAVYPSSMLTGYSFDWSPDGRLLLYSPLVDCCASQSRLYIERADGGGRRELTAHRGFDEQAVFSPDGRSIAFVRDYSVPGYSEHYSIWTMPVRGGRPTRVWSLPLAHVDATLFPRIAWQPLGNRPAGAAAIGV